MYDYKKEIENREDLKQQTMSSIYDRSYFNKSNEKSEHLITPKNSYIPTETLFFE